MSVRRYVDIVYVEKVCRCRNRNWQEREREREMRFYLIFNFLGFKEFNKRTINIFKDSDDFGFSNFIRLDREV